MQDKRWLRAQKQEKSVREKMLVKRRGQSFPEDELVELAMRARTAHLRDLLCKASVSLENLKRMRILEIGGQAYADRGLQGIKGESKIVLDPLIELWSKVSEDCEYVRGMGEYIPLKQGIVDLCWCANTIDHTASPLAVLREIRRVLSRSGRLIISCNVFHSWACPFFPIFDRIDTSHPHHFTESSLIKLLLSEGFNIEKHFPPYKPKVRNLKVLLSKVFRFRLVAFRCIANKHRPFGGEI